MFSVRRANIDDLQLIVDFQIKMAVESEGVDLEEATINSGVGAVLKGEVTAEYWLVESEDGPVGMAERRSNLDSFSICPARLSQERGFFDTL